MAATTSQWSRPLVNVYGVKAAWCICSLKSCVIHAERFRGEFISMGCYTNLSTFTFTRVGPIDKGWSKKQETTDGPSFFTYSWCLTIHTAALSTPNIVHVPHCPFSEFLHNMFNKFTANSQFLMNWKELNNPNGHACLTSEWKCRENWKQLKLRACTIDKITAHENGILSCTSRNSKVCNFHFNILNHTSF